MDSRLIGDAHEFIKHVFANDHSGHDYCHSLRVWRLATRIARQENADLETVQLAALLHDVDDIKLSPDTHEHQKRTNDFLRSHGVPENRTRAICEIISEVSFAGTDSVIPSTVEGQCVQDADRLDALGAIGIARTFAYGGNHGRPMHDPDIAPTPDMAAEEYHNHLSTSINHFHEKLFLLTDLMNTRTAKTIAMEREHYMREYVARFLDEWDGVR